MNNIYRLSITLSILFLANNAAFAQFAENIASGRPGNANGAFSVGKGVYQVQAGYNYFNTTLKPNASLAGTVPKNQILNGGDVLFRIGIKEDVELRLGGVFVGSEKTDASDISPSRTTSGLQAVNIGIRNLLFKQKGILPATAIQFAANFGGSEDYKKSNPDATFRINFSNLIAKKLNLNWNFSSRWAPDNSNIVGFYIFSFSYPLIGALTATAETFGNIEEQTTVNGGFGLSYIINSNFQLDAYGSYGSKEIQGGKIQQEDLYISTGISFRLVKR